MVLRMDEHLLHVISDGRVVKTMPLPIPADRLPGLRAFRPQPRRCHRAALPGQ
ncbi:hypothetical protein SCOCK_580025 [Actinacidiphila cocklensis]|uniref:Uncharacterized protein n=1 Tax=Actinacidiphila cocklensis TaxID=887465 RepID=A0A9W4GWC8_9ACTN|nr:hypothetical protein SCOCK_580025 [Actinacidiphila cocklensis]